MIRPIHSRGPHPVQDQVAGHLEQQNNRRRRPRRSARTPSVQIPSSWFIVSAAMPMFVRSRFITVKPGNQHRDQVTQRGTDRTQLDLVHAFVASHQTPGFPIAAAAPLRSLHINPGA